MKSLKAYHHLIFGIIFLAELIIIQFFQHQFEFIIKPTILLWIIFIFLQMLPSQSKVFKWGLFAFIFSLLGDVVLLFSAKYEVFFLVGIGCFLISHLFFIVTFNQHSHHKPTFLKTKPLLIFLIVIIGISFYAMLFPHLDLVSKIAVFVYAATISTMLLMALNRKNQVNTESFIWVTFGAILFFMSDSLLAINRFWIEIPLSGIWIMSTYMLAQYFILAGLVNQKK